MTESVAPELTPAQLCRQTAIEYIGLGGKSSGKVRRKLRDTERFPDDLIETVIAKLIEDRYIDDPALARRVLRDRRGRRAEAPPALVRRMVGQGIPEPLAEDLVAAEGESADTLFAEWAEAHRGPELDRMAELAPFDEGYQRLLARVARSAASRTFGADTVLRGLERLIAARRTD